MGTLVNTIAVIVGSLIGMGLGRFIPQRLNGALMQGLGLCTAFLGIMGFSSKTHPLILIFAMVLGIIVGELADLDALLIRFSNYIKLKLSHTSAAGGKSAPAEDTASPASKPDIPPAESNNSKFSEGFIAATLLWCSGAMVVVGCIQDGMQGDPSTLYAKSALDLVSSIMFASSLGVGVLAASASVLIIQGSLTLAAGWLAPFLTDAVITDISTVGSLLLVALSLNILGLTKIKVMNFTPACLMPILIHASGLAALISR